MRLAATGGSAGLAEISVCVRRSRLFDNEFDEGWPPQPDGRPFGRLLIPWDSLPEPAGAGSQRLTGRVYAVPVGLTLLPMFECAPTRGGYAVLHGRTWLIAARVRSVPARRWWITADPSRIGVRAGQVLSAAWPEQTVSIEAARGPVAMRGAAGGVARTRRSSTAR